MDISLLLNAPLSIPRLIRNNGVSRNEIIELQNKKLGKLVKHSFENVLYYHKLFRASGIRPEDIRTIDDLDKIPISKKTDFSNLNVKDIAASNINLKNCDLTRTSGTSGVKLEFYREKKALNKNLLRHYYWQLQIGDKIANRHFIIGGGWLPPNLLEIVGIFPVKRISHFSDVKEQIKSIDEFDPAVLIGLPSALRVVATEALDRKLEIKIPLIFAAGEMLDVHTRQIVQKAFDSEVFDIYGLTEIGGISAECRVHSGQHVWGDQVVVEISEDGEKLALDEEGSITVTNLDRYVTPFIRYNTGDVGMLIDDTCICNSQFSLMRITEGRKSDTIHLNDGRSIPAFAVCYELYAIRGIKQFQVVQETVNDFKVRIVRMSGFTENLDKEVAQLFEKNVGKVNVKVEIVDNIPKLPSGKLKQFISHVSQAENNS